VAVLFAREDVEADFRPVVETLGELDRLVLLVVRGINAINGLLLALHGRIRVQFDHQGLRSDRLGPVDLDLVIGLGMREER
jgi:hypothetical protein